MKVYIEKITPSIKKNIFWKKGRQKCYLGISYHNKYYDNKKYVDSILEWINTNFQECKILVDDTLQVQNEILYSNLSYLDACEKVRFMAKEKKSFFENRIRKNEKLIASRFDIIFFSDVIGSLDFKEEYGLYNNLFSNDKKFRNGINDMAVKFTERKIKQAEIGIEIKSEAIESSVVYLLKEIGVFSCLSKWGYNVEVYPGGEIEILEQITNREYSAVPDYFTERINLEIKFKK